MPHISIKFCGSATGATRADISMSAHLTLATGSTRQSVARCFMCAGSCWRPTAGSPRESRRPSAKLRLALAERSVMRDASPKPSGAIVVAVVRPDRSAASTVPPMLDHSCATGSARLHPISAR